jgi:hypothetical protein
MARFTCIVEANFVLTVLGRSDGRQPFLRPRIMDIQAVWVKLDFLTIRKLPRYDALIEEKTAC